MDWKGFVLQNRASYVHPSVFRALVVGLHLVTGVKTECKVNIRGVEYQVNRKIQVMHKCTKGTCRARGEKENN